jgi:hypothetical protein
LKVAFPGAGSLAGAATDFADSDASGDGEIVGSMGEDFAVQTARIGSSRQTAEWAARENAVCESG